MNTAPPTVEAVVVTHRRPKNLLPVLTALRAQSHQLARVTVIDASPSASFRPTAGFDLADCVMRLGTNFGAFNRYVPLLAYRADFTLFVDDDFAAGPDAVRRMATVAAMRPDFGVIGEIGRTFAPLLDYSRRDVRADTKDVRPVDLIVRGYPTRTPTLHVIAETLWRLPAEWQHQCIQFDDLLLCVAMKLRGWPCIVYRPNGHTERLVSKSLPDNFGLCHRRNHVPERVAFLRMACEHLGWKPLSDSAA
jgi:hypothetical protein